MPQVSRSDRGLSSSHRPIAWSLPPPKVADRRRRNVAHASTALVAPHGPAPARLSFAS